MDAKQLVELVWAICYGQHTVGDDADLSGAIKAECAKLEFGPHQSREKSKALQAVSKGSKTRRSDTVSDDFFWRALQPWAASDGLAMVVLEGSFALRGRMEQIAVKTTELIGSKPVPLAWALNVPPKRVPNEEVAKNYNAQDILAQLCLQLLHQNPRLHQKNELRRCLSMLESATSEPDWFTMLVHFIDGLDQVFIVVDLGSMATSNPEAPTSWPRAFASISQKLSGCIVKVVLFTYRKVTIQGLPQVNVVRFPQENSRRSENRIRPEGLDSNSGVSNIASAWLEYIGPRQRSKRSRTPLEEEVDDYDGGVTMTTGSRKRGRKSYTWFDYWSHFDAAIDSSRKDEHCSEFPRVKVAILDTGADLSHPDIAEAMRAGRVKYRSFINDNVSDMCDTDGHGTHCTSLVLKYAPNAEVYIGRVFEKSNVPASRLSTLADAVQYASENWRVDIISISLGFPRSTLEAERKFELAAANRVLIFASASNNTIHEVQSIRFPANLRQVFCVFSADEHGSASTFNPRARYQCPNFMLPGENVLGAWPVDKAKDTPDIEVSEGKTYRHLSGTSCATPIAAAIAAEILEFAWQPRDPPFRRGDLLKRFDGMEKVFIKMADRYQHGDGGYHYVLPWKVLTRERENRENQILLNHILESD